MKFFICFLFAFWPTLLMAQSNYQPGYVVTLSQDTIKGFINYHEWNKSPRLFELKHNVTDKRSEKYTVNEAKEISINGLEYYSRFNTKISTDYTSGSNLSIGIDSTWRKDTVFMQRVATGKNLELYIYSDHIKTRFFLLKLNDRHLVELGYHKFYSIDNDRQVVYSRYYINQLRMAAAEYGLDEGDVRRMIERSGYATNDFVSIVNSINDVKKPEHHKLSGISYYAGAGISSNSANTNFQGNLSYVNSTLSSHNHSNISPIFLAGVLGYVNKNTKKIFLRGEVSYLNDEHQYSGTYKYDNLDIHFTESYSMLNFTLQLGFNFYSTPELKAYLSVGTVIHTYLNTKYNYYTYNYLINKTDPGTFVKTPTTNFANVQSRAGFVVKKIEVFVQYEPPLTVYFYNEFVSKISYLQSGITYHFGL